MKKRITDKIIYVLIIILFLYAFRLTIFKDYSSSILIIFNYFMMLLINIPIIELLKRNLKENKSLFYSIVLILLNIVIIVSIYSLGHLYANKAQINNWTVTNYDYKTYSVTFRELRDFLLSYNYIQFPYYAISIISNIFLAIITIVHYFLTKTKNKISFITEKAINLSIKIYPVVLLLITLLIYQKEYLSILYLLPIVLFITMTIFVVYFMLVIRSIKHIQKNSKKDTLVIVNSLEDYKYNPNNTISHTLNIFKNEYQTNSSMFGISLNNELLVSKDIVINKIIDISKYKDILNIYVINENKIFSYLDDITKYFEYIEEKRENREKLIITSPMSFKKSIYFEKARELFNEDFTYNSSVKELLDKLLSKESNQDLLNEISKMEEIINLIPEDEFIKPIKVRLKDMKIMDSTSIFYTLINLCEYVYDLRFLKYIANDNNAKISKETLKEMPMGAVNEIQCKKYGDFYKSYIKTYNINPIDSEMLNINDIKKIREISDSLIYKFSTEEKVKGMDNKIINKFENGSYIEICNLITTIRNRTIGHGTITYEFAKNINYEIAFLVVQILKIFTKEYLKLNDSDYIKARLNNNIPTFIIKDDKVFIYKYGKEFRDTSSYEYLNFETGKIIKQNNSYKFKLDLKLD